MKQKSVGQPHFLVCGFGRRVAIPSVILERRFLPPYDLQQEGMGFANVPGLPRLAEAKFSGHSQFSGLSLRIASVRSRFFLKPSRHFSRSMPRNPDCRVQMDLEVGKPKLPTRARSWLRTSFSADIPLTPQAGARLCSNGFCREHLKAVSSYAAGDLFSAGAFFGIHDASKANRSRSVDARSHQQVLSMFIESICLRKVPNGT